MKRGYYNFVGIYIFIYGALGMLLPLLGPYLFRIGMTGFQVGTITSAATCVSILANPFWGARYQHSSHKKQLVLFLCIASLFLGLSLVFLKQYVVFLAVYALLFFFHTPVMPLFDAMILERKYPFGAIRKYGALGFAGGVFVAGQVAEAMGLESIFVLYGIGYSIAIVMQIIIIRQGHNQKKSVVMSEMLRTEKIADDIIPNGKKADEKQESPVIGYTKLLKNKKLMALIFSGFFIYGPSIAHNTYFGFLYKEVGGSVAGIGIAFLLMAGSEAPMMGFVHRLSAKFTMERMLLFSMFLSAARFFWYGTAPSPTMLMATFFIQGIVNGIFLVEFVHYITKLVDPVVIGMSMTLYQAISSNSSTILCQLMGGVLLDWLGSAAVYTFFGAYNVVGIILFISFGLHRGTDKVAS